MKSMFTSDLLRANREGDRANQTSLLYTYLSFVYLFVRFVSVYNLFQFFFTFLSHFLSLYLTFTLYSLRVYHVEHVL